MSKNVQIDAIDRRILEIIQRDATYSIQDIGEQVGLSTNPCWRRIKRMEDAGIIERRVAILNPVKLGLGVTAFVSIRTNKHTPDWLASFAAGIRSIPEIIECHRMSGDVDYLLKIAVADIAHYDRIYQELIAAVPGLSDVSSTFSMERLKYGTALAI
ncbi:Lrp/AsnC family transcriptional regulator [Sphingorhabdus sp.]|uniref:Lrp/AsnC family transcriptional regulator n=1 Tax=Sphingorhabdus sp. TaxID=1902408 RepID=UPI0038FC3A44